MFIKETLKATRRKELEELFSHRYGKPMTLEEGLYDMYMVQQLSCRRIAAQCYMSTRTVVDWLKDMGLYVSSRSKREMKIG